MRCSNEFKCHAEQVFEKTWDRDGTSHHAAGPRRQHSRCMTTLETPRPATATAPPYSNKLRAGLGVCLVLAGLLNGGAQYLVELLSPDHEEFSDQFAWGLDHPVLHQGEQLALVLSMLFLPLGLLALAQVSRWHTPKLTAVATLLTIWGMWGFSNVIALGYGAGSVGRAPSASMPRSSQRRLHRACGRHGQRAVPAPDRLVPGPAPAERRLLALRVFPKVPLAMLSAFLVWDFTLPSVGPLEPHLLLMIALGWLGRPPDPDAPPDLARCKRLTTPAPCAY